jgi:YegS/Rv2252/BmrU family lipid kinase
MTRLLSAHSHAVLVLSGALGLVLIGLLLAFLARLPEARPRIRVVPLRPPAYVPRAAVVINPTRVADMTAYRRRISATMHAAGWAEPLWLVTTADDTGLGMAREAVRAQVEVVFVCGGDGTVRAAVAGLMRSGVPLALLPAGTGNLLVRNLRLPMDLDEAVHTGLVGTDHAIDVGMVGDEPFTVMAGIGFDAAIMADAPEKLKRQVGWPAYIVSGLRHLRDRRMHVTLRLDSGEPFRRRARAVVVGNVGALQAGVQLLPDARPDDGILDVVVLAPKGLVDWARVAARVLRRRTGVDHRIEHFQARQIEIEADRSEPRELDGDLVADGTGLSARLEPRALLVRVPVTWSPVRDQARGT